MQRKKIKSRLSNLKGPLLIFIILSIGLILLTYYRLNQNPAPKTLDSFQELLVKNCKESKVPRDFQIKKIDLSSLPVSFGDLVVKSGWCDNYGKYIWVPLDGNDENSFSIQPFITVSDNSSSHCCHGPSSIEPTGKLIKTDGDVKVYLHTGTWDAGPNSNYKPVIARAVKTLSLPNGEELRIVLDRVIIDENDSSLQALENQYKVIDSITGSGKYIFTPDTVKNMFEDSYFSNISEDPKVSAIITEIQGINLK